MLYSVENGKYVTTIPYKREYSSWMKKLSPSDYQTIVDELNNRIDGSDVNTSSWIPGKDWTGTVFEPLYYACSQNMETSGLFFGLILYNVMMQRTDIWGFGRYEKDGVPIRGMTYFKLNKIP